MISVSDSQRTRLCSFFHFKTLFITQSQCALLWCIHVVKEGVFACAYIYVRVVVVIKLLMRFNLSRLYVMKIECYL